MGLARKLGLLLVALGVAGAAIGWFLSAPVRLDTETLAAMGEGDAARGRRIFFSGGCSSCHAKPKSVGDARLQLPGGLELKTPFGTFVPPNISSDPTDGIGAWSKQDFANAMLRGVSPDGRHYYPAFPYASYIRMKPADVADLYAFMKTLPAVQGKAAGHQLSFPFTIRRGLGLWKRLYLDPAPVVAFDPPADEKVALGQYLAEGPGHCGECHTPRDFAGGTDKSRWLAGAKAAEGSGNVPNITGGQGGLGDWSAGDIETFLKDGTTPDFDFVGGSMADVVKNLAELEETDRAAIAAYLKAVPAQARGY
ncbi:MAG TPA: cytochrome c [Mesorhizobium sp.]|jgi:mono/diheme cytochrome c family protein